MKVGLIFKLILLVSIIPIGSTVQAQLSAITANTIQGSAPNIISAEGRTPDDINDILHFTIPNPQQTGKFITYFGDSSFEDVTFPETLTFNDFNIQDWDNSLLIDYDGDQPHPTEMITYTNLTATWVDKLGNTPNLADNLDSCFAPYKLTVKAENLTVKTEYGNPNHNTVGTLTKTFSINVDEPKICFIQPSYLGWASWANSDGTGRPLITIGGDGNKSASGTNFGGGYSDDFLPTIGFKAHIDSDKFPTTAFKGAAFTLITAQTTSPINFDITSAPSFTTLTANGTFTFNTQPPSLPYTVNLTANSGSLSYSFTIKQWFTPKIAEDLGMAGSVAVDYNSAKTACQLSSSRLPTRKEMTSSPKNTEMTSSLGNNNVYTRAIGSLIGEWGSLQQYKKSNWLHSYYWTDDLYQSEDPFVVGVSYGSITLYSKIAVDSTFLLAYPTTVCVTP